MIYDRILVRYGDLTLKGRNQKVFVNMVLGLVKTKLKGTKATIEKTFDRLYILLNGEDYKEVIKRLGYVSGLYSYSLVVKCDKNLDSIKETAVKLLTDEVHSHKTFKVESRRADKTYPLTSQELSKEIAGYVLKTMDGMFSVDVHHPEVLLTAELRFDGCYLFTGEIKGMGGFPVGVAGKGLLMLSGGIDSPVAGYLAMKQGIEIECIHFESTPLTSIESAQKVIDLVKKMAIYAPHNRIRVHMVPFKDIHQQLLEHIPESYNITIMRRMMYRIATKLAYKNDCLVLVNGESVGQVASQTLGSMSVINSVTNIPVIRPVCTYDKLDIITISKKIDTYDISIKPFQDCCTVYVPKNPATAPRLDKCELYEQNFDYEKFVDEAVNNTKYIDITSDSDLDITFLGLEVSEIIDSIK